MNRATVGLLAGLAFIAAPVAAAGARPSQGVDPANEPAPPPDEAIALVTSPTLRASDVDDLKAALRDGDPNLSKVDSDLLRARLLDSAGLDVRRASGQFVPTFPGGDLVPLDITVAVDDAVVTELESAGLVVDGSYPQFGRVSGRAALSSLSAIAAIPEVRVVRREAGFVTNVGSVTSEADNSMNTDDARSTWGIDGSGVTVGVLSDSFADLGGSTSGSGCTRATTGTSSQTSGDLPPSVFNLADLDDVDPGTGSDEGRAMAELIADIAPAADLMFHTAIGGQAEFAEGITELKECGADVIVDDISYFLEPMFQDGVIAQAAQDAVDSGVPYFSSAGNQSNKGIDDAFNDSAPTSGVVLGDDFHDFDPGPGVDLFAQINLDPGDGFISVLQWNEPFDAAEGISDVPGNAGPGALNDFDLFLFDGPSVNANLVASSVGEQGCSTGSSPSGDPLEFISGTWNGTSPTALYLAIEKFCNGPSGALGDHLRVATYGIPSISAPEWESDIFTDTQIYGHAAAEGAVAVAAIDYCEVDNNGNSDPTGGPGVIDVEPFSSLGGDIPIYFNPDGSTIPGGTVRPKPEITAPDGTNTTFFGGGNEGCGVLDAFPNFYGTSAAAPHAAGAAALLLEQSPMLTPEDVLEILQNTATDIESPGFDDYSGAGVVNLTGPTPTLKVEKVVVNDNGGTAVPADFTMNVTGTNVSSPSFAGSTSGTTVTLDPGDFSVTETGPAGYTSHFSEGCMGGISLGQDKVCTVTNDDIDDSLFVPVEPFRLEDTRQGGMKVGSADGSAGPLQFSVLGRGGLPLSGIGAVSLNVTVTQGEKPTLGGGFVTVDGCSTPRPNASNLNFGEGDTVPNAVITPVSPMGDVCVYVYGKSHILVDINGYFPSESDFEEVEPSRLEDTRGASKVGSDDGSAGPLQFNVLGRGGLPASGVGAVSLNVTVTEGEKPTLGGGFVTVDGCSTPRPNASNLNFGEGDTVPNAVLTPVSPSGDVCVYVYGTSHILVDVNGYFPDDSDFGPVEPFRLEDTRGGPKVGSDDGSAGPLEFNVLGRGGVPNSGVEAVSLNVTATQGELPDVGGGFVTVDGCATPRPNASNLNFTEGETVPNAVITPVSSTGDVCVYVYGTSHILVDVNGYFPED